MWGAAGVPWGAGCPRAAGVLWGGGAPGTPLLQECRGVGGAG